ncbi:gamma-glutamylaminecyclotransferase [Plakobranchus ocellatus]|uniref:Gamma-glutamylcyclotransferase family protein n=1 Tax=Plakobranchus ocellatus TaxID=259542 RepID=A0AAV4CFT8_9GAST|nr:gamma-glutamylaminecyclotransferase [Plakobranchus ocellatus]
MAHSTSIVMSSNGTHIVFVYGTLKTKQRNHDIMTNPETGSSKYLGVADTVLKYPMIVYAELSVPFLLLLQGHGEYVEGELYEVDDAKLRSLDELEDHPNFYQRLPVQIKIRTENLEAEGNVLECWAYFMTRWRQELLDLPKLKSFSSSMQYKVPPEERKRRKEVLKEFIFGSAEKQVNALLLRIQHIYCLADTVRVGVRITEDHYPTRQFPSTLQGSRQGHLEHVRHGGRPPSKSGPTMGLILRCHLLVSRSLMAKGKARKVECTPSIPVSSSSVSKLHKWPVPECSFKGPWYKAHFLKTHLPCAMASNDAELKAASKQAWEDRGQVLQPLASLLGCGTLQGLVQLALQDVACCSGAPLYLSSPGCRLRKGRHSFCG